MLGIGTDILRVSRLEEVLARHGDRFVHRILAPRERLEYSAHPQPARYLAKRFAAKEAVGKALGTGIGQGVSWQHIEIVHNDLGAPAVELDGAARLKMTTAGGARMLLSISDEHEYVVAFAAMVGANREADG